MDYLFVLLAALATVHASYYGYWLMKNGNKPGALFVFAFAFFCLALPVYNLFIA